jgi:hypothetical protein
MYKAQQAQLDRWGQLEPHLPCKGQPGLQDRKVILLLAQQVLQAQLLLLLAQLARQVIKAQSVLLVILAQQAQPERKAALALRGQQVQTQ